jgi:hypothetical protein
MRIRLEDLEISLQTKNDENTHEMILINKKLELELQIKEIELNNMDLKCKEILHLSDINTKKCLDFEVYNSSLLELLKERDKVYIIISMYTYLCTSLYTYLDLCLCIFL